MPQSFVRLRRFSGRLEVACRRPGQGGPEQAAPPHRLNLLYCVQPAASRDSPKAAGQALFACLLECSRKPPLRRWAEGQEIVGRGTLDVSRS